MKNTLHLWKFIKHENIPPKKNLKDEGLYYRKKGERQHRRERRNFGGDKPKEVSSPAQENNLFSLLQNRWFERSKKLLQSLRFEYYILEKAAIVIVFVYNKVYI